MASTTGMATEDNDRTPLRSPRAGEEEEEAATTISIGTSTGPVGMGGAQSPPASDIFGFGTEATYPDDESRPVTNKEFTRFRHRVENTLQRMYADVIGLISRDVEEQHRQRDAFKHMMAGRMQTLSQVGRGRVAERTMGVRKPTTSQEESLESQG